ncbi:MAG: hypothetical protein ACFFE8_15605 [Candidatus Heimdallarchaeota archaeon]
MMNPPITQAELEADGWIKKFTIDEQRIAEYVELYESLNQDVRVVSVVPEEIEGCTNCFEAECNKFKTIYTRPKS